MSGHHHYTTKGYNGTNQRSAQHDRHDSSGKHRSGWGADREKTTYRVPRPDFESMAGPSRKLQRLLETRPGRDDYNQIYTRQYYMGLDTGTCVVKDSQTQCKEQKLETSNDDCDLEPPSPPTISDALPSLAPEPPMDINWDASNTAASGGDDDVDDNDPFSKKSKENQLLFNPEAKDIIVSINDNDINSDASNTAAAAAGYDGDNDPFSKKCRENQLYFNPEAKVIESISDNDINWDDDDDDPFSKKCKENQLYFNPEAKDFIASVSNKDKNDPLKSTNSTEHLWSRENAINSSSSSSSNSSNSSNIEIGEHEDDVLGHMTKFEKRRFKNALSAGFSHNEALKISADPLVFVGFTSNSPSTRNLSENQMAQLRALIEKTAVNSKFNTEIVTFYHERGWLKLACTNNTAGWLKSNFQELHKIYSLHINFVDEANFPPTFTVRGNFPDSLSFPTTKILDLIKAANNDMDVSLWKLVKRKATKEEHFLTFEIDGVSWCKLIKLRGIISYGHVNNLFLEMKEIKHSGNGNKATEKEATIVDATEELANELEHARGNFSRIHVIRGEFPRSHEYAEDKILNLVKAQNSVDISLWRVIHRTGETELDVITFEVDHRSWLKLKGENGLICYRFGHIQLDLYADAKSRLLVRANFLHSHNYSSGKVLALIKAQNDLNVSQWLPEPRTSEDLFFTFEVDEDSWCKLLERNGVISYRFGQMKLEMIETKALANHKAIDETTTKETLIVHGEFPHSTGYSTEKILTSIQTQNDLNVSLWKPLPRRSDKDLVYSFEVDASSWNKLKKQGGCITYGFGHVELEMLKKQSDGAMVQSSSFNLLCRRIVQGKFPSSKEYTAEKVLPLIKIQNDLDVSLWKPLPRSNNNNHDDSNFVFDIDESSWHKLQKTNGLISFGFGQVTLTLIDDGQNGGGGGVQFARPNQRQPSAYRRLIEGDFPGSNKSSAEQIVALIKSQNDLDVSLWKPLPKDTNDTIFCFEIDNNSWQKLQKKKGIISYRFNQIKLKFIDEEIEAQKAKYLAQRNTNESQGRHLVRGCFPHSQEYSPAHVLHLIQTQNYYVNLSLWKPLPRDKKDNIFSFETDKTSWQTLQKRKAQIYYGRGQVKLKLSYEKNDVGQGQMEQQIHDTSNVHIKEQNKHSVRNERPSSKLVVQGNFAQSSGFSGDKVLALINAQNKFDVSQWIARPKKSSDDDSLFTFEIDKKSWHMLQRQNCMISYRFSQMQLKLVDCLDSIENTYSPLPTTTQSPLKYTVCGNFPTSVTYSIEKIKSLLKIQNNLDASLWKLMPNKKVQDSNLTFEIDERSWQKLRESNGVISYGLGKIKLVLIDNAKSIENEKKSEYVNTATSPPPVNLKLNELKNRIALHYDQMQLQNDAAVASGSSRPISDYKAKIQSVIKLNVPIKPYKKPPTTTTTTANTNLQQSENNNINNPLSRLAELKNRISHRYDQMQTKLTDNKRKTNKYSRWDRSDNE